MAGCKKGEKVILCVWCWWNKVAHCECAKGRLTECKDYKEYIGGLT